MKLSLIGPILLTVLSTLGMSDGIPDKWSSWGVVSILVWFLFYTVKFWIPSIESRKQEDMVLQRREFLSTLASATDSFTETLRATQESNDRDRKATRRILKEVVETEKNQMELILKMAQTKERLFTEMAELTILMKKQMLQMETDRAERKKGGGL